MPILSKEEVKRVIEENNLRNMDDLDALIYQLEKEMIEAILKGDGYLLGYSRYDRESKNTSNSRNGYTSKEVYSKSGKIRINVPKDRESSFEPELFRKREKDISK